MVNIARFDVFAMTILGKITNKKALTIYTILGAGILFSLILASPVAYTWAQYQLHGAGNNSLYLDPQMQYMKRYESTIPKINGSVNIVDNIGEMFKQNAKVSFPTAAETAQKQIANATVVGGHLGITQGYLTYTYLMVDTNKQIAYRVIIDAGNGNVLYKSEGQPIGSFGYVEHSRRLTMGQFDHFGPIGHFGNFGPFGS
jgi:uncharacterized membrane protein YkoI